jgi:cholesterol oxidase
MTTLARGDRAERWDFVIIGSGFGGSVSALRLTEKGYRADASPHITPKISVKT